MAKPDRDKTPASEPEAGPDRRAEDAADAPRGARPVAIDDDRAEIGASAYRRPTVLEMRERAESALAVPAVEVAAGPAEEKWPLRRTFLFVLGASAGLWSAIAVAVWQIV